MKTDMAYATKHLFENTELGYSLRSLDKAWVIFALSLDSKDLSWYINDQLSTDDTVFLDDVAVWLSPVDAKKEIPRLRDLSPLWDWHILNVGDYLRQQRETFGATAFLGGKPFLRGRHRASDAGLAALYRHLAINHPGA